ncbi:MAG: SH3 domain-containing protein [Anaerolineae bacterium]|nr:SH3 domain-containing protein [Anaerolineae bacterium]
MKLRLVLIITLQLLSGNMAQALQADTPPQGVVNSGSAPLRLRAGPGLDFSVLALLSNGTALIITARSADSSWLQVQTNGPEQSGWVYRTYITTSADLAALPIERRPLSFARLISGISDHTRRIYRRGQALGNHADVFAKIGDSITVSQHMFHPIGEGLYNIRGYPGLQPVIDYFSRTPVGSGDSFTRNSVAAGVGWNAAAVLLSKFADRTQCQPAEIPLICEYRLIQPAFALIMLGTNDTGYVPTSTYRHNLERIIQISVDHGVVPVLSTIPPRRGYEDTVQAFNQIIREVAQEADIPLWDYHAAMVVYPQTSLTLDGVHPSLPPRGHDDAANFADDNLPYGYVLRNLSALYVLDALRQQIVIPAQDQVSGS